MLQVVVHAIATRLAALRLSAASITESAHAAGMQKETSVTRVSPGSGGCPIRPATVSPLLFGHSKQQWRL